ncbi:L,D-transpeptidase family protein [Pedobacter sp.]|uniref:L,D-transpeptidase family protein n=1 Tax=Pedobacter sp. TaxID=1411316 RepID=UPI003D7F94DA
MNKKIYANTGKISCLIILFLALATLQSCKKSRSDIGQVLFKETKNKVYKGIETDAFIAVFKKTLEEKKSMLRNPKLITAFYESNDFDPVLVTSHLPDEQLKTLSTYLTQANTHGLDPQIFSAPTLSGLVEKVYDKKAIKTVEEAYKTIAELELLTANSLIDYSNAMQYGMISPRRIYASYYTETDRPDSVSMMRVFAVKDLKNYLDSIQPKSPQYLALQKGLASSVVAPGMTQEETLRMLQVNLERLRWKNRTDDKKYVVVNIPDFTLNVMENDKSVLNMKVCVGEGRKLNASDELKEYDETDLKKDRPFRRETPQLGSMIHSVQVNPVWNIPESIATNEIRKHAAADRYYLSNNNIDVFKDGKIIEDTELIDWSDPATGKNYSFKQRPGDDNSLGKIKFLFKNDVAVYLHDTPAKAAFDKKVRAVSHGCVRVEKPLELAQALFGNSKQYEVIKTEMAKTENQEAKDIALPTQVPVYLTYFTTWVDANGTLQFRNDIYGLDVVLYSYLQKLNKPA